MLLQFVVLALAGAALTVLATVCRARRRSPRADDVDRYERADAELRRAAVALGARFESAGGPAGRPPCGAVTGRRHGCVFTLGVAAEPGDGHGARLEVRVLHYGADQRRALEGPGLDPTGLDLDALRRALDRTLAAVVDGAASGRPTSAAGDLPRRGQPAEGGDHPIG